MSPSQTIMPSSKGHYTIELEKQGLPKIIWGVVVLRKRHSKKFSYNVREAQCLERFHLCLMVEGF